MADQTVDVELPAVLTEAHRAWLAVTRVPLRSLRFLPAAPETAPGHDDDDAGAPLTEVTIPYVTRHNQPYCVMSTA